MDEQCSNSKSYFQIEKLSRLKVVIVAFEVNLLEVKSKNYFQGHVQQF